MCIKYCILNLIPSPQIVNEEVEFDIILTTYNMVIRDELYKNRSSRKTHSQ